MLPGAFDAFREAVQAPGYHQRWDVVEKKVVEAFAALSVAQSPEIGNLRLADHLKAAGVKIIVKAVKLEAWPV